MVLIALLIGVLGGYGAIVFRVLISEFQRLVWDSNHLLLADIRALEWYWILIIPTVGGVFVGAIVHYFAAEAKGHGVPEVMEAIALREGRIRPRVVIGKAVASSLCIATGGSVGREGPIVQIGAALGSTIGQWLKVGPGRLRTLTGCGAAAGIAATFNAPVAGALFAVEVVLGDFGVPKFSMIVLASVAATVVSRSYLGNFPTFDTPPYTLSHPGELIFYAVLGAVAALVGVAFIRVLCFAEDRFDENSAPLPIKTAIGGTAIGVIALAFPGVLGVGHESVNNALQGTPAVPLLLGLLVAKLLATSITLGSGGSGGIFAPSLFLGGTAGALVGNLAQVLAPETAAPPGAYALVGMGAVVAATTHAPITAILIIFEMTNEYEIILPLMTSCIIATLVSSSLHPESIYTVKLVRRGVNIRAGQNIDVLRNVKVREVMRPDPVTVSPNMSLPALLNLVSNSSERCFYVVDDDRHLRGVISMLEVQALLPGAEVLRDLVLASDVASTTWPSLTADEMLDRVVAELDGDYGLEIPVVEDGVLIGALRTDDVLTRYKQEVLKREMAVSLDHH